MEFRTELFTHKSLDTISHGTKIVSVGSCFAETIGNKLASSKFSTTINPFGIIYNPLSLFQILRYDHELNEGDFIVRNGTWFYFGAHSTVHALSKDQLMSQLTLLRSNFNHILKQCQTLIVTFGSSYAYQLLKTERLVANCHKLPQQNFSKHLLSTLEIVNAFHEVHGYLTTINPGIRIILTVSPVRHLKDTLALNNVSKSILRVACHEIVSQYPTVAYFPAFELMVDDLRDYRYYKEDMIHPTSFAENYIWEKFSDTYFSFSTKNVLLRIDEVQRSMNHIPFYPTSAQHIAFLEATLAKAWDLHNDVDMAEEVDVLNKRIIQMVGSSV